MRMRFGLLTVSVLGLFLWTGGSFGQEPDLSLGTKTWPAVTNGLVFIDGEYIPPPYTVSRVENVVVINGRRIESGIPWPPPKAQPPAPVPETDPVIPTSITEKSTQYDEDVIRFIHGKRLFLFAKYGHDKGIDRMVEVYKSLPCITSAERDTNSSATIILVWKSGDTFGARQAPPSRKPNTMTKAQAQQMMDRLCESYTQGLADKHFFMFGDVFLRGTTDGYKSLLAPFSEAMKQATNEAHLASMFKTNLLFSGFSKEAFRSFYKHKDDLPKWEPRIRDFGCKKINLSEQK